MAEYPAFNRSFGGSIPLALTADVEARMVQPLPLKQEIAGSTPAHVTEASCPR